MGYMYTVHKSFAYSIHHSQWCSEIFCFYILLRSVCVCECVTCVTCESLCTEFAAKWLDYRNDRGDREEHTSSDGSSMHINSTRHLVFSHRTESELVCYLDLYASTSLVCVNSFSVRVCFWRVEMDVVFVHVLMQWGSERKRSSLCLFVLLHSYTYQQHTPSLTWAVAQSKFIYILSPSLGESISPSLITSLSVIW